MRSISCKVPFIYSDFYEHVLHNGEEEVHLHQQQGKDMIQSASASSRRLIKFYWRNITAFPASQVYIVELTYFKPFSLLSSPLLLLL